uniref:Gustatory receptor n=1 Tax=Anopheles maculatus TaxID=74869 RepID=A0A182T1S4_9DIPT
MNLVLNCFCVYINVSSQRLSRFTGSAVMDMGLSFLFPMGAIFMILLAIDNFLRRNITIKIIAELFKVDRSLQRKNYKLNHRRHYVVLAGSWWIEQKQRWGRRVEPIDVVADLAEDFATLAHVIERANRIYANQTVALISGVVMFSIFVIYASSYSYYVGSTQESRLTFILLTAWVFYIIMVALVFFSGVGVENTGNDIAGLLHEALQREQDLTIRRKLTCFSQQVLLRPPKLRCMFYDYNWKTLFSFDKISDDSWNDMNFTS